MVFLLEVHTHTKGGISSATTTLLKWLVLYLGTRRLIPFVLFTYINQNKSRLWGMTGGPKLSKVRGSKNDSDKTILTEKDIVKESGGGKRWSERTWKNSYS
jgi:hypothetical protein